MHPPPCLARPLLASIFVAAFLLWPVAQGLTQEPPAARVEARGDAYRPLGPELFPFYEHYLRTADSTEIRNILHLYTSADNPNGSWSRLLVPFFYREHATSPPADLFFLFPLLFLHKTAEEESFNYWLPLFYDRRTPGASLQLLFPLWLKTHSESVTRHHILFPLFRHTGDDRDPTQPVTSDRAGLWKVLDLWESRIEPGAWDYRALTLFNWKGETRGGLSLLYLYSWARDGERLDGRTYFFPFYWHGRYVSSQYRWIVPFFGFSESPGEADYFLVPLLSRIGGSAGGERRLDVLYPLFHYAEGSKSFSVASFPLFGYSRTETQTSWNALFWLYRTTYYQTTAKRTHSVLFPLSHFDVEPDDSKGTRWLLPYIETFDDKRLWRFVVPLYYEYQTLAGGNTDWFLRTTIPLYWSWGYANDYFSTGFPLYWASRDGPRGWQVFLPIFLHSYSASSRGVHVLPLVSYRSFPSRQQLFIGGPLYVHEQFYNLQKEPSGSGNHVLWPFFAVEHRDDGHLYRALPFFWSSREGDTSDLLLSPFYYQADGPLGTHRYILPLYGHYESSTVERDLYAAGSYIFTRGKDEAGATARTRHDILWSLFSFEEEKRIGGSHQHILPLGYWNTRTPVEDQTVAGPFYYSHRISEGGETHHLSLILGNLYFSKVVEGPPRAAEPNRISSDQGILWPFSRWYQDGEKSSARWVLPVYFDVKDELSSHFALFPFYFQQREETPYSLSYFRYFFLFDRESWRGGHRWTVGQLLFDWKVDEATEAHRLRLLYPLIELASSRDGYSFQLTPLLHLSRSEGKTNNYLFPIFWQGGTERKTASGEVRYEYQHFFLFPFYGVDARSTRSDHYLLFPLVHFQLANEAFRFELWPSFFYRNEPGLHAVRLWPLHAEEAGLTAGEFWVSRYLFLSKHFATSEAFTYRFDPFLFRTSAGPDTFGLGGLFELLAYDREGADSSFRIIPLVFGYTSAEQSAVGFIPFYFEKDFGKKEINYAIPWRFLFLNHHFRGASGERSTGVLFNLFEYTDNPNRPGYQETGFLYRLVFSRTTETSRQFQVNPLFSYFRDEILDETRYSVLLSLYSFHETRGKGTHTLLYFIHF